MICREDVVYLSGPMTGLPDYNRPEFIQAELMLRLCYGCKVLNPARWQDGLSWTEYMRLDMELLREATVLVRLPGWKGSRGAVIEDEVFSMGGLLVVDLGE